MPFDTKKYITHAGNISVGELSETFSDGSCNVVCFSGPCLNANGYFGACNFDENWLVFACFLSACRNANGEIRRVKSERNNLAEAC